MKIPHHIAESNWINYFLFIVVGVMLWFGWTYVKGLQDTIEDKNSVIAQQKKEIENAKLQQEMDNKASAIIYGDVYERLENMEKSKKLSNATWKGVRRTKL